MLLICIPAAAEPETETGTEVAEAVTVETTGSTANQTAQTQTTAGKRLFTVKLNDGYQTVRIPIYETADSTGRKILTAETSVWITNPAAGSVTAKIQSRTKYYRRNYTKVSVTKKGSLPAAGSIKNLKIKITASDGTKRTCRLQILRPAKPKVSKITPAAKTLTTGNRVKFTIRTATKVPVTLSVRIAGSSGDTGEILRQEVGSSTNENQKFIWYWDGRNQSSEEAEPGTYKVTAVLSYTYGKKTKTAKKSTTITVEKAADSGDSQSGSEGSSVFSKNWDWQMMVTGDATVDYLAEYICQKVLNPGMSEIERAKALYGYCTVHCTPIRKNTWSGAKAAGAKAKINVTSAAAKKRIKAYRQEVEQWIASGKAVVNTSGSVGFSPNRTKTAMALETGDCLNMARMYQVLCRHAGIDANILYNPNYPHFWNTVQIAGVWYECDPRMGYLRKEGYVHFLRGTEFMESVNIKEGNNADDVRRYGTISSGEKYQAAYKLVSKTDCPGR